MTDTITAVITEETYEVKLGEAGPKGDAATIVVDSTTTLAPSEPAVVVNVGTPNAAALTFGIPKGDTGNQGLSAYEVAVNNGFVGTEAEWVALSQLPAGITHLSLLDAAPDGYLLLDGSTLLIADYPRLYAAIGIKFGGDGVTTFKLPDVRGRFMRFTALGSTVDPDRNSRVNRGDGTTGDAVGTLQNDQYRSHFHQTRTGQLGFGSFAAAGVNNTANRNTTSSGGSETRPTNIYMTGLIKY